MLNKLITPQRIIIWDQPALKEVILQKLVEATAKSAPIGDPKTLLKEVLKREEQGSTFFNEGVAFPHARINGLTAPIVALGLTREGVSDVLTEKPIEIVFLILSPAQTPGHPGQGVRSDQPGGPKQTASAKPQIRPNPRRGINRHPQLGNTVITPGP